MQIPAANLWSHFFFLVLLLNSVPSDEAGVAITSSNLPVIGLVQASHFLAYRLPKHLRQYGLSSREVKC